VGLHRPNPVALEMPGFISFFARPRWLAEREGFEPPIGLFWLTYAGAIFREEPLIIHVQNFFS